MMDAPETPAAFHAHVSPYRAIALGAQARIAHARLANPEARTIHLSAMEWGIVKDVLAGHRIAAKPQTSTEATNFDDTPITLEPGEWLIVEAALGMF